MRALPRLPVALSLVLLGASPAYADGSVVGRSGAPTSISSARVAVALGPHGTTRWLEVTVDAADEGFLWVVPVAKGARIGTGESAWLDRLDGVHEGARAALLPVGAAVITDEPTLEAAMAARGAALVTDDQAAFASMFERGAAALLLEYPASGPVQTTGVVRVDEDGPLDLELPTTSPSRPSALARLLVIAAEPRGVVDTMGAALQAADTEPATLFGDQWITRSSALLSPVHGRKIIVSPQPSSAVLTVGPRAGAATFDPHPDAGADASASTAESSLAPVAPSPDTLSQTPPPPVMIAPAENDDVGSDIGQGVVEGVGDAASGCGGDSSEPSDDSGSGCDSSSGSSDSSSGCSGSSSDSSPDCAVRGSRRHRNGVGVRLLVFGVAALAWARRATRRATRAGSAPSAHS